MINQKQEHSQKTPKKYAGSPIKLSYMGKSDLKVKSYNHILLLVSPMRYLVGDVGFRSLTLNLHIIISYYDDVLVEKSRVKSHANIIIGYYDVQNLTEQKPKALLINTSFSQMSIKHAVILLLLNAMELNHIKLQTQKQIPFNLSYWNYYNNYNHNITLIQLLDVSQVT